MKLDREDLALLRDLLDVLGERGNPCFLVGAGARILALDVRFGVTGARATFDWDFAVQAESWKEWSALRDALCLRTFRPTAAQHRLVHERGGQLDLVPFGELETETGEIVWPDDSRMSVRDFEEAARHCVEIEVERGLRVQVASLPSLALLKLHAYTERRRRGVVKDIQDFDWILRHYDFPSEHVLRIHDELADVLIASGTEYSEAGAMLLGTDVARFHSTETVEPLRLLLGELGDAYSRSVEDMLLAAGRGGDEHSRNETRRQTLARGRAFLHGLMGTNAES